MKRLLLALITLAIAVPLLARPMPNAAPPEGVRGSGWVMSGSNNNIDTADDPEQLMGDPVFVHLSAGDALELIGSGGSAGQFNVAVIGTYLDSSKQTSYFRMVDATVVATLDTFLTFEYAYVDSGKAPTTNALLIRKANGDTKVTEMAVGKMLTGGAHKFTHGETYITGMRLENVAGTGILTFELRIYPDITNTTDLTDDFYKPYPDVTIPATASDNRDITFPQAIGVSRNSYIAIFVTTTANNASASASLFGYQK